MARRKLSVDERASRVDALVRQGNSIKTACEMAGIGTPQYYNWRKKQLATDDTPTLPRSAPDQATSLVGRVLMSNLSADDKITLLQSTYQ